MTGTTASWAGGRMNGQVPPTTGSCASCGTRHRAGAEFCGRCGSPVQAPTANLRTTTPTASPPPAPPSAPPSAPPRPTGDAPGGTTRFLGAAVHLDEALAERLIGEFLVEPWRSVPRSPGVDAASVLGDAAASHRRRQIRDGVLLALALVALLTQFTTFVGWTVLGAVVAATTTMRPGGTLGRTKMVVLLVVALLVLALGPIVVGLATFLLGSGLDGSFTDAYGDAVATGGPTVGGVLGVIAMLAIPAVLLTDELLVVTLVRRHFSRSGFTPAPADTPGAIAALRRIGRTRFARPLHRTAAAERPDDAGWADVVVFRGDEPFVGAGERIESQAYVIPLEPRDDAPGPPRLSARALHADVAERILDLKRTSSLGLHGRLDRLRHHEQVLVASYDLLSHRRVEEARLYLPHGPRSEPAARVRLEEARRGIDEPREWARYYQCFQVEGWERDLTVSCYVTLGTDERMLYLEWSTCVLPPLDPRYRVIDDVRALQRRALTRVLRDLLTFPVSIVARAYRVGRLFAPIRTEGPEEAVPAQYGAFQSLRETAAGPLEDYFHTADVIRYAELFDRSILEAVRGHLDRNGLKIADIEQIVQSVTINGATNSVFSVGAHAQANGAAGPAAPTARTGTRPGVRATAGPAPRTGKGAP